MELPEEIQVNILRSSSKCSILQSDNTTNVSNMNKFLQSGKPVKDIFSDLQCSNASTMILFNQAPYDTTWEGDELNSVTIYSLTSNLVSMLEGICGLRSHDNHTQLMVKTANGFKSTPITWITTEGGNWWSQFTAGKETFCSVVLLAAILNGFFVAHMQSVQEENGINSDV